MAVISTSRNENSCI